MRHFINIVESPDALGFTTPAYHGTKGDIEAFRINHGGQGSSGSREGPLGIWFTDSASTASHFADWASRGMHEPAAVFPVLLRIRNPLVISSYDEIRDLVDRHTKFSRPNYQVGGRQIRMGQDRVDYEGARRELLDQGHDAIVLPNTMVDSHDGKPITQYLILDPRDIRSRHAAFKDGDSEDLLS